MTTLLTCQYQIRSEGDGENGKSMAAMQKVLAHIKAFNERKARSKRASLIKVRLHCLNRSALSFPVHGSNASRSRRCLVGACCM